MRPLLAASLFLLLLIVLVPQAWGQTRIEYTYPVMSIPDSTWDYLKFPDSFSYEISHPTYHFGGTDTLTVVFGKDTLRSTNPYGAAGLYEVMRSWKEYKAECYADSTQRETGTRFHSCLVYGCKQVWEDPRMIWVHRTPTFNGWMDWLERKLK